NTATGGYALFSNTSGNYNTALGLYAGAAITTGSNNTAVGANANVSVGILTNATAIGANATVTASNRVKLGNNADIEFDKALMPAGNSGAAGQVLVSNGSGAAPAWSGALPGVQHLDINATNVTMSSVTSLGTLTMTLPGPGYVVVHFDGFVYA